MSEPPPDAARGPQPTIVSGTLVLRPWRPEDALQVMKAFSDPDIQRWSGIKVGSQEDAVAWIACWDVKWAAQSGASWAVTVLGEPAVICAQVALRSLWVGEMGELSYWVVPDHRGLGIAPRATRALAAWALSDKDLDLSRLELAHSVRNRASCRVALKAGFTAESYKHSLQKHGCGELHDMHVHALVRPAQVRVRAVDTALLAAVAQVRLWLAVTLAGGALMLLTLVSRLALIVPVLVAAGVLSLHTGTVGRTRRRSRRWARRHAVS